LGRQTQRFAARLQYALNLIESTEVPVIGALQGQVLGLGLELVLAFDLRVASSDLTLSIPEALNVGLDEWQ
jgi:enoyl-CoA hydratase/carnithine racemase